jgi:SAM-dependent methyltransferase
MVPFLKDKAGLEIGGPSRIFCAGKLIPVYNCCRRIDSCNFSDRTIWSGTTDGRGFGGRLGRQFVAEACDLATIPNGTYDFVLASHVLEHSANPLSSLQEWKRVLTAGGVLLVVVPDKRYTFDHWRQFTPIEHIEADFRANVREDDLTHLDEVLALHDVGLDPWTATQEEFRERCLRNSEIRAIHHHVFSPETLNRMFTRLRMRTLSMSAERPNHIVGFAQKVDEVHGDAVGPSSLGSEGGPG